MTKVEQAIRRAVRLLDEYDIQKPPVDVQSIAVAVGAQLIYQSLEPSTSGLLVRTKNRITVGINALHHPNRQRFTIAHEIGHLLLHAKPTVFVDELMVLFREDVKTDTYDIKEVQANAFAAEFLMPERFIRNDLRGRNIDAMDEVAVRSLAHRYQVSQQAITIRLINLGLLEGLGVS